MTVARDTVEEANAAIGAAVSTLGVPDELERLLQGIQLEMLELADALDGQAAFPSRESLRRALAAYPITEEPPHGFAVLGGFSSAAGLLKFARAITNRALRTVTGDAAAYLRLLADVLLAAAFHVEQHEQNLAPLGICGGVVGPAQRSH